LRYGAAARIEQVRLLAAPNAGSPSPVLGVANITFISILLGYMPARE
jgi:hypothetical protein